jgi:hypothetical protein
LLQHIRIFYIASAANMYFSPSTSLADKARTWHLD